MKRLSIWFALILILSALLLSAASDVTAESPSQPNQGSQTQAERQQHYSVASPSVATLIQPSTGPSARRREPGAEDQSREASPSGNDLPAWLQAIATILLVLFAGYQMRFIKRATGATEASADAAKDSALAAKESADTARESVSVGKQLERAWIIVEIEPTAHMLRVDEEDYGIFFKYAKRNFGRSIGWLMGGFEKAAMFSDSLPEVPEYEARPQAVTPVAPSQSYSPSWYEQRVFLNAEQWRDFALGKTKVALYGVLYYRDSVGEHETRFCVYAVPPVHEQPWKAKPVGLAYYFDGPPAYNRYT